MRNRLLMSIIAFISVIGFLLALPVSTVSATGLVARVTGSGIQFDGNGFYPGELVQINGIRYDGSQIPFGPATVNNAGAITGVVPYHDTALYQIDARGYTSGAHAVSNIAGALPYPVVPPGYPYVEPTYPYYTVANPTGLPINGGYANTGYPFTGAPYGGNYPGSGFGYPLPPSGVTYYPYVNGGTYGYGGLAFVPNVPFAPLGTSVAFSGSGWAPGVPVSIWSTGPDGTNLSAAPTTVGSDGSFTSAMQFSKPGTWQVFAKASGMDQPISAVVQVNG